MTALFTASYRAFRPDWGQAVVTSRSLPKWRLDEAQEWPRLWVLTPTHAEFGLSGEEFTAAYLGRLSRYGAARIARSLENIARHRGADRLVLCCFEAEVDRCHRGNLAAWWLAECGEDIAELT